MNEVQKIVLYDFAGDSSLSNEFREKLRNRAKTFEIVETEEDYSEKLSKGDISDADILISRVFDNYKEKMFKDSDLQYIGVMATDKSHYPIKFLEEKNVEIRNASEYARESVAELTINMMLQLSLQNYKTNEFVESGNWNVGPFPGSEVKDKELGIIGLGSIGSRVAEIAEALGMNISYFSRSKKDFAEEKGWKYKELERMVSESDIITIHCSLNQNAENLLDRKTLEKVKEDSIILNAAREEIQNVEKTIKLCEEGKIKAWFDALEEKEDREKILETGNAILTSHSGCATKEAKERLKQKTIENLDKHIRENQ